MSNREWVEKLGTLDTETYPWQLALIEELMEPFQKGQQVLFVDKHRARRLFPWEEVDASTGCVNDIEHYPNGSTRYGVYGYKEGMGMVSVYMLEAPEYLKILRYFFDKGEFSDR